MQVSKAIYIKETTGLHASIAARLVQVASRYNVEFDLHYGDKTVDLKSILGVMSLAIPQGSSITITANGADAEKALQDIEVLLNWEK